MRYSEDFIEKVRDANNIVDIISQYTQLKPAGSNLMGLCPFPDHNEKSASFSVSASKQLYHCFGCKKSGNTYSFLQQYNGMNFVECIEFLADRASIALPEPELDKKQLEKYQERKDLKKELAKINEVANSFFKRNLASAPMEVKTYIEQRNIKADVIEKFHIGYALESWDSLVNQLQRQSYPISKAETLGLVKARNNASGFFDMFRNRLMFPILSPSSEVLGFGGRVLAKEDKPKYLNSPESPLFHKGEVLYGLHETAKFLLSEDLCIVVEGYMDLIALYSAGVKNVVANLGTAFTAEHVKLIKRYTSNILVLFDGDSAGQLASERALPILLEQGAYAYGLSIPDAKDPDDFLKENSVESFRELLSSRVDLYFWYLDRKLKDFERSPTGQIKIIDLIYPVLSKVQDKRLRELYLRETADRIGVEESWLRDTMRQMWLKSGQSNEKKPAVTESFNSATSFREEKQSNYNNTSDIKYLDISRAPKMELELLKIVLNSEDLFKELISGQNLAYISSDVLKEIFVLLRSYYGQEASNFDRLPALVVSKLKDPSVITQMLEGDYYQDEELVKKLYSDCIKKLQMNATKIRLKELRAKIKSGESEQNLEEYMKLIKNIQS